MVHKISPNHIAIIVDGNRRWAKEQGKPAFFGHMRGYERVQDILLHAKEMGISVITLWAFSTENWKREESEVSNLLELITKGLSKVYVEAKKEKMRIVHLGRRDRLGKTLSNLIEKTEEETKEYKDFTLCIAIDYGGQDEIERAEKRMLSSIENDKTIIDFLDTSLSKIPNPDIVIRTGGEKRTSGFMPLQSAYSEWFFEEKLFPDFDRKAFDEVIKAYSLRSRRFGK
jgi:undecaprenyl diphosphate synthase